MHAKPAFSIRNALVHPKDKAPKLDKSGVIYNISCSDCECHYVGETERALRKRAKEHQRDSSPVGHHMRTRGHCFSEENIKILDTESDWFRRGVREAVYINITQPQLNRDRGRHLLPPIYRTLLQSCDSGVTPESRLTGSQH